MMKKWSIILLLMAILPLSVAAKNVPKHPMLLPMPYSVKWGKHVYDVSKLKVVQEITDQVLCYRKNSDLYFLSVDKKGITIIAPDSLGLLRGQQTLKQLIMDGKIQEVFICDMPQYQQRGVSIDVSRHFFSKDFIKKQILAMEQFKLNRLHLHLTDAAGWRIEIKQYPRLTQLAAWRTAENWKQWWKHEGRKYSEQGSDSAFGGYYTQEDIKEMVAFAKQHGVTIVPELELPGHSEEVFAAYPELCCSGQPYKNAEFCAGNEQVYTFWRNVLSEVVALFPNTEIHIGGDEAGKQPWKTCPKCQAVMKEHDLADLNALQTYFVQRISDIAHDLGTKIVGWDDLLQGGAPEGATIQIWGNINKAKKAIATYNPVILSPAKYLYIDAYEDSPLVMPEAIGGYTPLETVYSIGEVLDTMKLNPWLVRGIEACLWSEYVPTEEHMEEMLYPRLMAVAEVGWGTRTDLKDFRARAKYFNDQLRANGYAAFDMDHELGQRPEYLQPIQALSVGKPVTYNAPYSPYYPAAQDSSLTDGKRGGWTYSDGRWQGFIHHGQFDATVDLLESQDIHSISLDFLHVAGAEVYWPAHAEIQISEDGENFRTIWQNDRDVDVFKPYDIVNATWTGTEKARYVRVKANTSEEHGGWIFTDEIVVK